MQAGAGDSELKVIIDSSNETLTLLLKLNKYATKITPLHLNLIILFKRTKKLNMFLCCFLLTQPSDIPSLHNHPL